MGLIESGVTKDEYEYCYTKWYECIDNEKTEPYLLKKSPECL